MKAIKVTAKNEVSVIELNGDVLSAAIEEIGGFEQVRPKGLKHPYIMIVDDEFLLKKKPLNVLGSALYGTHIHGHPICGDILFLCEECGHSGVSLIGLNDFDIAYLTSIVENMHEIYQRVKKTKIGGE